MDYPGKFNNDNASNDEIFKDKVVWNHPAGNVEFVNTKDSESVTVAHKNASSLRFDKFGTDFLTTRDKREHVVGDSLLTINGSHTEHIDESCQCVVLGDTKEIVGDCDKWKQPMMDIKNAERELHDMKRLFEVKRTSVHNSIDQSPLQTKSGSPVVCRTKSNESKVLMTETGTEVVKEPNSMPRGDIIQITDNTDIYDLAKGSGGDEERCLTCWGKIFSPSTQDGGWLIEEKKAQIVAKREQVQKKIYEYEKQLGQNKSPNGGTSIKTIAKNFIENIGLVFNDFESYRKDPSGKLVPCGVKIDPLGTTIYTQYRETALIETVDVEGFPGGSYDLNICDKWTVTVGSNGITFKTTGPMNIYSPMIYMQGESINIGGSTSEVRISGERVDVAADVISLRPNKNKRTTETGAKTDYEQQLLIDGNLNVGLNAIVRGGLHVEGELTTHHITAPCEYQITESDFTWGEQIPGFRDDSRPEDCDEDFPKSPTYATLLPGLPIGICAVGPVFSLPVQNFASVDPHFHYFKNVPLKLFKGDSDVKIDVTGLAKSPFEDTVNSHNAVRSIGARNNAAKPVLPQPVVNSKTEDTVINKFGGEGCEVLEIANTTDWPEEAVNDSLPDGEGVRTKKYTAEAIKARAIALQAKLEAQYAELQKLLSEIGTS